jgi:hypothetical protein
VRARGAFRCDDGALEIADDDVVRLYFEPSAYPAAILLQPTMGEECIAKKKLPIISGEWGLLVAHERCFPRNAGGISGAPAIMESVQRNPAFNLVRGMMAKTRLRTNTTSALFRTNSNRNQLIARHRL